MNITFMLTFFKIGAIINVIAILIALVFIIIDVVGQSSADNTALVWAILVYIALLTLGIFLKIHNHVKAALLVIWVPALPVAFMGILFLLIIILKPDWK